MESITDIPMYDIIKKIEEKHGEDTHMLIEAFIDDESIHEDLETQVPAENNLKRADELKKQQEKQLENLKKQAEEATKYKEISQQIKSIEAGLYYLKLKDIEKETNEIKEKSNEIDDDMSAVKIDIGHNKTWPDDENW